MGSEVDYVVCLNWASRILRGSQGSGNIRNFDKAESDRYMPKTVPDLFNFYTLIIGQAGHGFELHSEADHDPLKRLHLGHVAYQHWWDRLLGAAEEDRSTRHAWNTGALDPRGKVADTLLLLGNTCPQRADSSRCHTSITVRNNSAECQRRPATLPDFKNIG